MPQLIILWSNHFNQITGTRMFQKATIKTQAMEFTSLNQSQSYPQRKPKEPKVSQQRVSKIRPKWIKTEEKDYEILSHTVSDEPIARESKREFKTCLRLQICDMDRKPVHHVDDSVNCEVSGKIQSHKRQPKIWSGRLRKPTKMRHVNWK